MKKLIGILIIIGILFLIIPILSGAVTMIMMLTAVTGEGSEKDLSVQSNIMAYRGIISDTLLSNGWDAQYTECILAIIKASYPENPNLTGIKDIMDAEKFMNIGEIQNPAESVEIGTKEFLSLLNISDFNNNSDLSREETKNQLLKVFQAYHLADPEYLKTESYSKEQAQIYINEHQDEIRKENAQAAFAEIALNFYKQLSGEYSEGKYPYPLPKGFYALSSGFGIRNGKFHDALDFSAQSGTPVYAVADGVVTYSGWVNTGGGNTVKILHTQDCYQTKYCHMATVTVTQGSQVRQGDIIGYVGNTGNSTGPHLHFCIYTQNGTALNPQDFLSEHIKEKSS